MGIKASNTAEVYFEDCPIPVENLLGGNYKLNSILFHWKMNKDLPACPYYIITGMLFFHGFTDLHESNPVQVCFCMLLFILLLMNSQYIYAGCEMSTSHSCYK